MPEIHEKLLSSMADLKIGQIEMACDIKYIKKDMEETNESIKLSHNRISKVAERTDELEGWRDEQHGKGKAWKIVGGVVAALATAMTILTLTGSFN